MKVFFSSKVQAVAFSFAALTILLQIAWPLASTAGRVSLTSLSVLAFAAASVTHFASVTSWTFALTRAAMVLIAGFILEYVGSATGLLFGDYDYTEKLQPQLLGVPVAVMLAWFMMAWPAAFASHYVSARRWVRAVFGGALMMSWDFFLDPQMVGENYWQWRGDALALPGIPGIPLSNYACWFLAGSLLIALIDSPHKFALRDSFVPALLLGWTWFGGVVGHGVFWSRPGAAAWGGLAMGLLLATAIRNARRAPRE